MSNWYHTKQFGGLPREPVLVGTRYRETGWNFNIATIHSILARNEYTDAEAEYLNDLRGM